MDQSNFEHHPNHVGGARLCADPASAVLAWEGVLENSVLPEFLVSGDFFDDADPIIDTIGLGQSWINMQEWADMSFQLADSLQEDVVRAVEEETQTAGGVRFCCYGTIPNSPVKLVGSMPELHAKIDPNETYHSFPVSKDADYFMLKFADGSVFAQLNEALSRGLASLENLPSVEIIAFSSTKSIQHVLSRAKKPGEAKLKADINVYGSIQDSVVVGDKLGSAKMFLQDPEHGILNIEYANPHLIQFPGVEEPSSNTSQHDLHGVEASGLSKDVQEQRNNFDQALLTIYRSLRRSRTLEGMQGGMHLLTPLLPHQETALAFMRQRETGPIPPEFSLWKHEASCLTPIYRHKLTGAEQMESPRELGGGILADDMGMGKSLSTLALITSTREHALEWTKASPTHARRPRSKATLVLVPSTLILNSWLREIEKHLDKSLTVATYYGKDRNTRPDTYFDSDFVFTTYHTIASSVNQNDSAAFHIEWFRVVLDEAHMIRRRETTLYQAASQIAAKFRWCLTGTPIQNRLEDIGSLISFLQVDQLENRAAFRNHIVAPFADDLDAASKRFALLLDCFCLRRTQDLLHLPRVTERYSYITLSDEERRQYDETLADMARWIREKAGRNPEKRDQFGIFQAQLQLRLLCNHGTFQRPFLARRGLNRDRRAEREDFLHALGPSAEMTCSVCGIPIPVFDVVGGGSAVFKHACGHKLCQECILDTGPASGSGGETKETSATTVCPLCNTKVVPLPPRNSVVSVPSSGEDGYFNKTGFSSKLKALLDDLDQNLADTKSIVFSCWTRTLDLVSVHLTKKGIRHERIDGDQNLAERQRNMDRFITDARIPILLMSSGVGAFGLNLTAASRVFIIEPQWNPSVEAQAIGRVSRLGQQKDVFITRYLVRGTVEIKMYSQQIRKDKLAKLGFETISLGE